MSPENQPVPETQQELPYVSEARAVIETASKSLPETTENYSIIDAYVEKVLEAADKGEITGSVDTDTREKLLEQFEVFLDLLGKPEDKRAGIHPLSLIPSKDGLRSSFKLLMDDTATFDNFEQSLRAHVEAHLQKRAELLSPQNVQNMGDAELNAAEVEEPMVEARRAAAGFIESDDSILSSHLSSEADSSVEEPETELEMNERFVREDRAELNELYAKHRAEEAGSTRAGELENEIKEIKKSADEHAREVARLKRNSH